MTIREFFSYDYSGEPFILFGTPHIFALIIIVFANLAILYLSRRKKDKILEWVRYSLVVILLVNEALWHYWNYTTGQWSIQTMLPLHICSVFVFLSTFMLLTDNYSVFEFAYLLGIAGASQALLTPDAGIYGFPHFRFFQVMVSHGAIVTAALFMVFAVGYRPYRKSIVRVIVGSNIYMLIIGIVNWIIGSN
nr:TIGR02206 family membrane protein [Fodinibius sp.]